MKNPKLETRSFEYEGAYGSEQLDLKASKDVWKQLDIEVQKAYERGLKEGRGKVTEEAPKLPKGLEVINHLQRIIDHESLTEAHEFADDLQWLVNNYIKAINALAHMRACGDCAEDSWNLCPDGREAIGILAEGGRER